MARKKKRVNRYKKSKAPRKLQFAKAILRGLVGAGCVGSVVLFAVLSILTYDVFTQSPYFEASAIEIEGTRRLSDQDILKQAELDLGVNILSVSLKTVQDSLVGHPWIATARVGRNLPDRLTITITEREPMAVLDLGERFLLDTRGEIFKRCDTQDPRNLPVVTGLKFSDISVTGERMSKPYEAVYKFLRIRKDHDWALPSSSISCIQVDPDMGLTLVSRDRDLAVRLGYGGYAEKLMRLNYVLFNCSKNMGMQVALIDIVDVDRVVVRPREEV